MGKTKRMLAAMLAICMMIGLLPAAASAAGGPEADGPMPVDYYVNINGQWQLVGHTDEGWYGDYSTGEWQNTNRDRVTLEQMAEIFGPYGFDTGLTNPALKTAYQRKETDSDPNLHSDTQVYTDTGIGEAVVPLARNNDRTSGYNVYYLPGNTNGNFHGLLSSVSSSVCGVYTVSVEDPEHLVYGENEELPAVQYVTYGDTVRVTVKKPDGESGLNWAVIGTSGPSNIWKANSGDAEQTYEIRGVAQQCCLELTSAGMDVGWKSTIPYYVYLDGQWIKAGTDDSIIYCKRVGAGTGTGTSLYRYAASVDSMEEILAPYGFTADEIAQNHLACQRSLSDSFPQGSDCLYAVGPYTVSGQVNGQMVDLSLYEVGGNPRAMCYAIYYLPGNTQTLNNGFYSGIYCTLDNYTSGDYMNGSRFWTVSAADPDSLADGEAETRIVREGTSVSVQMKALPEGSGLVWGFVDKDGTVASGAVSEDNGDGTVTVTLSNVSRTLSIMPVLSGVEGISKQPVYYYVYLDGQWTKAGSTDTIYKKDGVDRWFVTAGQAESVLAPYGFTADGYTYTDGQGNSLIHQWGSDNTNAGFWSDNPSFKLEDGSWGICLTTVGTTSHNLYYLPLNTTLFNDKSPNDYAASSLMAGNRFWTVSAADPDSLADGEAETQIVREGTSVSVKLMALPEGSGLVWGFVDKDGTVAAGAVSEDNGDGTVTVTLENVSKTLSVMPVASGAQGVSRQPVYYYVYLDGQWTKAGSTDTIYKKDGVDRWFVTAGQAESVLAPYGFTAEGYTYTDGQGNSLIHQWGTDGINQGFWSDNPSFKLEDGSWGICLTTVGTTSHNLYYLPLNTTLFNDKSPNDYAASSLMAGNRFWSVAVRDDEHKVYSVEELDDMYQVVLEGGTAAVEVKTENWVLWSCRGMHGGPVELEQSRGDGTVTFTISNITQPIEVVTTTTDPAFTVQYFANIPTLFTSGSGSASLSVIDTTGKQLPRNNTWLSTKQLQLMPTEGYTDKNNGTPTQLYRANTGTALTRIYADGSFNLSGFDTLESVDRFQDENYILSELWVLRSGKNPESMDRNDWLIYSGSEFEFTNDPAMADTDTILITDGAVLRMVCGTAVNTEETPTFSATFYDYNIAFGEYLGRWWNDAVKSLPDGLTDENSIHAASNYTGTGKKLSFGNANTGTGLSGANFYAGSYKYIYFNQYSVVNKDYGGCSFGLVTGLDEDGNVIYMSGIQAPDLFDEDEGGETGTKGKQTYSNSSLTFERVGDNYTLASVTVKDGDESHTIDGLQFFDNPSPNSGTIYTGIFTNNFWPMDQVSGRTDPLFGQDGVLVPLYDYYASKTDFPGSDDGVAHNSYFGMNFSVDFELTEDYVGPLEYLFFGDDDLWVFLDGQLVCDLGGVHASFGEYVDLRDYLPVGSAGTHTLSVFYLERGGSGSTCYMSFTLPSASNAMISRDTGSLEISKAVNGLGSGTEYTFRVDLLDGEGGSPLVNRIFGYTLSDGTRGTIKSGGTLTLKADQSAVIGGIPAGTWYQVTELSTGNYSTKVNGVSGKSAGGTIVADEAAKTEFVNSLICVPIEPDPGKPELTEDHVAYIIGYSDGTVRPEGTISRAEAVTIFFRLLTDESRAQYWSQTNPYSDVPSGAWYNNAVSTLTNAGIIKGYPDGTFHPNEPITRAELAAIATRFSEVIYNGGSSFTDVPENHWAARYIALAEYLGWVNGYPDGSFRPDEPIIRAEAMTLINRVLEREVTEESLLQMDGMIVWPDNQPGTWYYAAVQEATNSHVSIRTGIQVPDQDFEYEEWTEVLEAPDWAALEHTWSTAYSE